MAGRGGRAGGRGCPVPPPGCPRPSLPTPSLPLPEGRGEVRSQGRTGATHGPRGPEAPLTVSLPLSGQVNNATARVMTNKKTSNPYTNGKGPRTPGRMQGLSGAWTELS